MSLSTDDGAGVDCDAVDKDYISYLKPFMVPPTAPISTVFRAVFIPYQEDHEPVEIYLQRKELDNQARKVLNTPLVSRRYFSKKDESFFFYKDLGKNPDINKHSSNFRMAEFLRPKRVLLGHCILVRSRHKNLIFDYHDITKPEFEKVLKLIKIGTYFDFTNNSSGTTDLISTILSPDTVRIPKNSWVLDKPPVALLNEYLSLIGKPSFQPIKIELKTQGPFGCLYTIAGEVSPPKTFASKIHPLLRSAQNELAHRIMIWYQERQISILSETEFIDDDNSFEEFQELQDEYLSTLTNPKPIKTDPSNGTEPNPDNLDSSSNQDFHLLFEKYKLPLDCQITQLTEESGKVTKYLIQPGVDKPPTFGSKVTALIRTYLPDGLCIDEDSKPVMYEIGVSGCMKGLELAIFSMGLKEKCLLSVQPEYAYGKLGAPPLIPPDSPLVYYLEITSIQYRSVAPTQIINQLTMSQRLDYLADCREKAKSAFSLRQFGKCLKFYKSALNYTVLDTVSNCTEDEWHTMNEQGARICTNLAITYTMINPPIWLRTREYCLRALNFIEDDTKALYWLAKSNYNLCDFESAAENIQRAIDNGDQTMMSTLLQLKSQIQTNAETNKSKQRKLYKDMFDKFNEEQHLYEKEKENNKNKEGEGEDNDEDECEVHGLRMYIPNN